LRDSVIVDAFSSVSRAHAHGDDLAQHDRQLRGDHRLSGLVQVLTPEAEWPLD
jgi:hypothetical protein